MARPKGSPKIGGRVAGTPNKTTKLARQAIADAFEALGGERGLVAWAKADDDNLKVFYSSIWPKIIPVQVGGDPDGVPIGVATDTPEGWEKRLSEATLREIAGLK